MFYKPFWFWALVAGALLALEGPAAALEGTQRRITVVGEGKVSVRPDVAQARLGVRVSSATVGEAMARNRELMQRVLETLSFLGIEDRDIATSEFSIHYEQPRPGSEKRNGKKEGRYWVNNMVRVTIRDLDQVDAVIDGSTEAGANQVWGVQFVLDDTEKAASQARRLAAEQAHTKAQELAALHGAKLGKVLEISEMGGGAPVPMVRAMAAEAQGTISAGELSFSARLQVVYALE